MTGDIIKEASDKLGMPEEEVKKVYDSLIKSLEMEIESGEIFSILFPWVGNLTLNLELVGRQMEKIGKNNPKYPDLNNIKQKVRYFSDTHNDYVNKHTQRLLEYKMNDTLGEDKVKRIRSGRMEEKRNELMLKIEELQND